MIKEIFLERPKMYLGLQISRWLQKPQGKRDLATRSSTCPSRYVPIKGPIFCSCDLERLTRTTQYDRSLKLTYVISFSMDSLYILYINSPECSWVPPRNRRLSVTPTPHRVSDHLAYLHIHFESCPQAHHQHHPGRLAR